MGKTFRTALVCCAFAFSFALPASAQLGVGVKVGATLTNAVTSAETASIPNSNTLIVGPYLELHLPLAFSVEVDALYFPDVFSTAAGGGSQWQFPVLGKFGPHLGPIRPYIEGGPSYSHLSDVKTITNLLHSSNYGVTLGAGVEIKAGPIRISPELRYNGVVFTNLASPLGLFHSNHNQAIFLVGFGF